MGDIKILLILFINTFIDKKRTVWHHDWLQISRIIWNTLKKSSHTYLIFFQNILDSCHLFKVKLLFLKIIIGFITSLISNQCRWKLDVICFIHQIVAWFSPKLTLITITITASFGEIPATIWQVFWSFWKICARTSKKLSKSL